MDTERAQLIQRVEELSAELQNARAALARAAHHKETLVAQIDHELRTALNAIIGLSESLQDGIYGRVTRRQQEALSQIQETGHELIVRVAQILREPDVPPPESYRQHGK